MRPQTALGETEQFSVVEGIQGSCPRCWCEPVCFDLGREAKPFVALFPVPTTEIQIFPPSLENKPGLSRLISLGENGHLVSLLLLFVHLYVQIVIEHLLCARVLGPGDVSLSKTDGTPGPMEPFRDVSWASRRPCAFGGGEGYGERHHGEGAPVLGGAEVFGLWQT